jgi:hypothetical protein
MMSFGKELCMAAKKKEPYQTRVNWLNADLQSDCSQGINKINLTSTYGIHKFVPDTNQFRLIFSGVSDGIIRKNELVLCIFPGRSASKFRSQLLAGEFGNIEISNEILKLL